MTVLGVVGSVRCPDGQTPACVTEGTLCTFSSCASAYKQAKFQRMNEQIARDNAADDAMWRYRRWTGRVAS